MDITLEKNGLISVVGVQWQINEHEPIGLNNTLWNAHVLNDDDDRWW